MQVDLEDLRRHYASLSDEALLALDRNDLTPVAQSCYDAELAQRGLVSEDFESSDELNSGGTLEIDSEADLNWLDDAACACVFSTASEAAEACDALRQAGIPCSVSKHEMDPPADHSQQEYSVMVPGALNLQATSVLDVEIFNPKLEADWIAHFEALSDDDLGALSAEIICAGLLDRVKRLKRAYNQEIARRLP